jgi:hypothetical protein
VKHAITHTQTTDGYTNMNKYLVALPSFKSTKGFNCPTILVKAKDLNDAIKQVVHLKPHSNIGDIRQVNY